MSITTRSNSNFEDFIREDGKELLELLYLSQLITPKLVNNLQFRSLKPEFYNTLLARRFGTQLKIVEVEGKHHDWVYQRTGEKVSVKGLMDEFFPRPSKINKNESTKGQFVQLVNTNSNNTYFTADHCDYLILLETTPILYRISVIPVERIIRCLSLLENGGRDRGQIRFIPTKDMCSVQVSLEGNNLACVQQKYLKNAAVTEDDRNKQFQSDIIAAIERQSTMVSDDTGDAEYFMTDFNNDEFEYFS